MIEELFKHSPVARQPAIIAGWPEAYGTEWASHEDQTRPAADSAEFRKRNGGLYRIRTYDPLIKSQLLYQLS